MCDSGKLWERFEGPTGLVLIAAVSLFQLLMEIDLEPLFTVYTVILTQHFHVVFSLQHPPRVHLGPKNPISAPLGLSPLVP